MDKKESESLGKNRFEDLKKWTKKDKKTYKKHLIKLLKYNNKNERS